MGYQASPIRAVQGRAALAADPNRQVGLLHRLGLEQDVGEFDVTALEARIVLGPQLAERIEVFVRDRAAFGKGRDTERLKLFLHPACTDSEGQPAV